MKHQRIRDLGVPLAKPRVALSAASPRADYRAVGFPLQSLTRNASSFLAILSLWSLLGSCVPSMSTGPDPHSIEYNAELFSQLAEVINGLDNNAPTSQMEQLMRDIGMMDYRDHGGVKLFFCGYGVVGKGWGFAYGDFSDEEIEDPVSVSRDGQYLGLTYLKKLDSKWYRFGAG